MTKTLSNVDPPLPDDVEVIDNLLKMKLKSNQVSLLVFQILIMDFFLVPSIETHLFL